MSDVAQAIVDTTALLSYLAIDRPEAYQGTIGFLLSTKMVLRECAETPLKEQLARLLEEKKIYLASPSLDSLAKMASQGDTADRLSAGELSALALADQVSGTLLTDPAPPNMKSEALLGSHRVLETVFVLFQAYQRGELSGEELDAIEQRLGILSYRFAVPLRQTFEELASKG